MATKLGCLEPYVTKNSVFPFLCLKYAAFSFIAGKTCFTWNSQNNVFVCFRLSYAVFSIMFLRTACSFFRTWTALLTLYLTKNMFCFMQGSLNFISRRHCKYVTFICLKSSFITWMVYLDRNVDQLPVALLAQMVEHCIGTSEVMGSNSAWAWTSFRSYLQLLVSVVFLAAKI